MLHTYGSYLENIVNKRSLQYIRYHCMCTACSPNCNVTNGCDNEGPGNCDECTTPGCSSCNVGYVLETLTSGKHACYGKFNDVNGHILFAPLNNLLADCFVW
jgi:hypothetical protein